MNQLVKDIIEFEYITNPKVYNLIESDSGISVDNVYIMCKKYGLPATKEFIIQEAEPNPDQTRRVAKEAINTVKRETSNIVKSSSDPTLKSAISKIYDAGKAVFSIVKEVSWREAIKFLKEFAKRIMGIKSAVGVDTHKQIKPSDNSDAGVNTQRGRMSPRLSASDFDLQEYNKEAVRTVSKSYQDYQINKGSSKVVTFIKEFFGFLMGVAKSIGKGNNPADIEAAKRIRMQAMKLKEGKG